MNIEDYREYCLSYNESPKHWIGINPTTAPDDKVCSDMPENKQFCEEWHI